jgi:hypothetical protein
MRQLEIEGGADAMNERRIWGTLTKTQHEVLCEFLYHLIDICPDTDNKIDPADTKRIAKVRKILDAYGRDTSPRSTHTKIIAPRLNEWVS